MTNMDGDSFAAVAAALPSQEEALAREYSVYDGIAYGAKRVVVVGCGARGRLALAGARKAGLDVVQFADNDQSRWGTSIEGVAVVPFETAVSQHNTDSVFIIAIYNPSAPARQLSQLGCRRIVPYAAFYWRFANDLPSANGLELPHRIIGQLDKAHAAYAALSDDRSRHEFANQIYWRCTLDSDVLAGPDPARQIYFGSGLFHLGSNEVLMDCGAYDGDSIRLFLDQISSFRHIHAFEPDARNRAALESYASSLGEIACRMTIWPYAIGGHDRAVLFNQTGTAGSGLGGAGTQCVECRRLDTVRLEPSPTLIKMDIEGSEPDALRGAAARIRSERPVLAICAYHSCDHLWALPMVIKEIVPDYRIYLRRYAEECWETVYYGIPPERVAAGAA